MIEVKSGKTLCDRCGKKFSLKEEGAALLNEGFKPLCNGCLSILLFKGSNRC